MNARGRREKRTVWTDEMVEYLKEHYYDMPSAEIAKELKVSVKSVWGKAKYMGLMRKGFNERMQWTDETLEYLCENYPAGDLNEMEKYLGCSRHAMRQKANSIGVYRKHKSVNLKPCIIKKDKLLYFGDPKRIGKNRNEVNKATWTVVCSCAIDGYTPEQTATMTERSVEQVEEVLKECKENGYLERIRRNRTEGLAARYDRSVLRKCSGAVIVE